MPSRRNSFGNLHAFASVCVLFATFTAIVFCGAPAALRAVGADALDGRNSRSLPRTLRVTGRTKNQQPNEIVEFTSDAFIGDGITVYDGKDIVVRGCTLTVDGAHAFQSLTIVSGANNMPGIVTHSAGFSNGAVNGADLTIVGDVFVEGGGTGLEPSRISVDARGHSGGNGPGAGRFAPGSSSATGGGGYGGNGGRGHDSGGGGAYGLVMRPTEFGSGGGNNAGSVAALGGRGGGAVHLNIGGTFTLEGEISANGGDGGTAIGRGFGGGGSGGSVWVEARGFIGDGAVSANGGEGAGGFAGGGGGGRIAIYLGEVATVNLDRVLAAGGHGGPLGQIGAAGSIWEEQAPAGRARLRYDNDNQSGAVTEWVGPGDLDADLLVSLGAKLGPPTLQPFNLLVRGDVQINAGASISADGRGFDGGNGEGAGDYSSSIQGATGGGGHAGNGGRGDSSDGGGTYGDPRTPTSMGSGGGNNSANVAGFGGAGGGAVILRVEGTLTLDGSVSADGANGDDQAGAGYGGGGAGGSVQVYADELHGIGSIRARGGDGGHDGTGYRAGGGGGGRVAIFGLHGAAFKSRAMAVQVCGGSGLQAGGGGTVWLQDPALGGPQLYFENCGQYGARSDWKGPQRVVADLFVADGARLSQQLGQSLALVVEGDASVGINSEITMDGRGRAGGNGTGAGAALVTAPGGAGGAGYGNRGGGARSPGGASYGSKSSPSLMGSGGGNVLDGALAVGGRGGGAMKLVVEGNLVIDGKISANGSDGIQDGSGNWSGGGSGGSVWIIAQALSDGVSNGEGRILANGGSSGPIDGTNRGGGGSGGRVNVECSGVSTTFGEDQILAPGGDGSALGGSGTVLDNCTRDCNKNGTPDRDDIATGTSGDCNRNLTPDECEPDCHVQGIVGHGTPDSCDIDSGISQDCNSNRIPDECDIDPTDPDGNGRISENCNADRNSIPDECEWAKIRPPTDFARGTGGPVCQRPDQSEHGGAYGVAVDINKRQLAAESFTFTDVTNITQLTWWGFYRDECGDSCVMADDFEIVIYSGALGPASKPLGRYGIGNLAVRMPTQKTIWFGEEDGADEYEYSATLSPPFRVEAGARYWVEISNYLPSPCLWWWETADPGNIGNEVAVYDADGNGFDVDELVPFDLALCVLGISGWDDCNLNGVLDALDITPDDPTVIPISLDCDENGVPDECDPDRNHNNIPDSCDIIEARSRDVDFNGVPDEVECLTVAGDLNGDCSVDHQDVPLFSACMDPGFALQTTGCLCGDFDGNGSLDTSDYLDFQLTFGFEDPDCTPRPADACPDSWVTNSVTTARGSLNFYNFGMHSPIPSGFFDPGSEAFDGQVELRGLPADPNGVYGDVDTQIQHGPIVFNSFARAAATQLDLLTLDLASTTPIEVRYTDGRTERWLVSVGLSSTRPPPGSLVATLAEPDGNYGTFEATVQVQPIFVFTNLDDLQAGLLPDCVRRRVLDTGEAGSLQRGTPAIPPIELTWPAPNEPAPPFVRTADPSIVSRYNIPSCAQGNFVPGFSDPLQRSANAIGDVDPCMAHVTAGEGHYFCPDECNDDLPMARGTSGVALYKRRYLNPIPVDGNYDRPQAKFPEAVIGPACPTGEDCFIIKYKSAPEPGRSLARGTVADPGPGDVMDYGDPVPTTKRENCDTPCLSTDESGRCTCVMATEATCDGVPDTSASNCDETCCCSEPCQNCVNGRCEGCGGNEVCVGGKCGPRSDEEQPGKNNPKAAHECEKPVGDDPGDPVYAFSGEFYETFEDLRIKGRGFDFIWGRKYRSKVECDTAQGVGWDFSYNLFIEDSGANLIVHDGNTRADIYEPSGTDRWGKRGFFRELNRNGDGTYTLEFANRGTWNFHPFDGSSRGGKIATSIDRNGNTMSFAYDALGRLQTITDTLGRDIDIAYHTPSADARIASITDFIGRQVKYEYYADGEDINNDGNPDGSAGDLKSVTSPAVVGTPNGNNFPNGKTTVYTYSTGLADSRLNHNLLTITDPKGQTYLRNEYDSTTNPDDLNFDRIRTQFWGNPDDRMDFAYVGINPPTADGAVTMAIYNDRVGNVKEFFYDASNRLVRRVEYTGRAIKDQATTEVSNRPTNKLRSYDPDSFTTRYKWNADSLQTEIVHPNGNATRMVYRGDVDPAASPRTRGNLIEIRRLWPNTLLNLAYVPPTITPGAQTEIVEKFEYDTDSGGCCGFNFVKKHTVGRGHETHYDYDARGNRIHATHRISSIVEDWEYNEFGQMTAHVLPDNGSDHRRRDEYAYYSCSDFDDPADCPWTDQVGSMQHRIIDAGGFALTTTYAYDRVGNLVSVADPKGNDTQFVHNALDQVVRLISREVAKGNGIRYERDYFFDANDNLVRVDVQNKNDEGVLQPNEYFTTIYEYEILNNRTRECSENGDYGGAISATAPTCANLPAAEFVSTTTSYDANRNEILTLYGEGVEGRQSNNGVRTQYDERDLVYRVTRGIGTGDPRVTASDQSTTQYDYDPNANLMTRHEGTENDPRIYSHRYDIFDRRELSADPMGNVTIRTFDANDNVVRERIRGELIDESKKIGVVDGGCYFSGSRIQLCDLVPSPNVVLSDRTYIYDDMDRVTRIEDAFFDTQTQASLPGGFEFGKSLQINVYTDNSQLKQATNDNRHSTFYSYDTANRRLLTTDAKGNTVENLYDPNSNIVAVTETEKSDLGGPDEVFTTTLGYDGLDRLKSVTDNVGNTNRAFFDSRDNRVRTVDALNHEIRFVYDGLDRLTKTIRDLDGDSNQNNIEADESEPADIVTSQDWDDTSRLIAQTDDNGNATRYAYDALNRRIATQMADGTLNLVGTGLDWPLGDARPPTPNTFANGYDVHDNPVTTQDANGSVVVSTFDGLDRVTRKDITVPPCLPGADWCVSDDTTFEKFRYDGLSRLVYALDDDSLVTRTYDSLSNILSEPQSLVGAPCADPSDCTGGDVCDANAGACIINTQVVSSTYDGEGNETSCTYPSGRVINRTFDQLERVKEITDSTTGLIARYDYVGPGRVTRREFGNGTRTEYAYDGISGVPDPTDDHGVKRIIRTRHTRIADGSVIDDRTYVWDPMYNKTQRQDIRAGGPQYTHDYEYDRAYRLVHSTVRAPDQSIVRDTMYNLDGVHNRESVVGPPNPGIYTMDDTLPEPADRQVNQYTTTAFDTRLNDSNGNLYRIDADLSSQQSISYDYRDRLVEYQNATMQAVYRYDALGRRIRKVIVGGNATDTEYYYAGLSRWQVCEDANQINGSATTYVYGSYIDEVLSRRQATVDQYYHSDDLFSVFALTDPFAKVIDRFDYGDYGAPLRSDDLSDLVASQVNNRRLFTGQVFDPDLGMIYYRSRYLSPSTGRFLTRDINGWYDALNHGNAYAYAHSNPWSLADPFGTITISVSPGVVPVTVAFGYNQQTGELILGVGPSFSTPGVTSDVGANPKDGMQVEVAGQMGAGVTTSIPFDVDMRRPLAIPWRAMPLFGPTGEAIERLVAAEWGTPQGGVGLGVGAGVSMMQYWNVCLFGSCNKKDEDCVDLPSAAPTYRPPFSYPNPAAPSTEGDHHLDLLNARREAVQEYLRFVPRPAVPYGK